MTNEKVTVETIAEDKVAATINAKEWWVDWNNQSENSSNDKTSAEILRENKLQAIKIIEEKAKILRDQKLQDAKILDEQNESLVNKYIELKKQQEILALEEKNIKPLIIRYLNDSQYLVNEKGDLIMTYKSHFRNSFDSALFKQENPDLYDKYACKTSEVKTLRICQSMEF